MGTDDTYSFSLEFDGNNALSMVQCFLQQIELNSDVERVSIEVESASEYSLSDTPGTEILGPETQNPETDTESPTDSDETENTDSTTETQASEPTLDTQHDDDSEQSFENEDIVRFAESSRAYVVAKMLYKRRDQGFLDLGDIQQFVPNDAGIGDDDVSQVLWDLADRGLVEKKQHPDDGRMKVYKITGRGISSVEAKMNNE